MFNGVGRIQNADLWCQERLLCLLSQHHLPKPWMFDLRLPFPKRLFEVFPCVKLASCTGKDRDSKRRKKPDPKVRVAETEEESLCKDWKKTFQSTPGIKPVTAVSSSHLATPTHIPPPVWMFNGVDGIQTTDLWCQEQLLYLLSQHHLPKPWMFNLRPPFPKPLFEAFQNYNGFPQINFETLFQQVWAGQSSNEANLIKRVKVEMNPICGKQSDLN